MAAAGALQGLQAAIAQGVSAILTPPAGGHGMEGFWYRSVASLLQVCCKFKTLKRLMFSALWSLELVSRLLAAACLLKLFRMYSLPCCLLSACLALVSQTNGLKPSFFSRTSIRVSTPR